MLQLPYPIAHRLYILSEAARRLNKVLTPQTKQASEQTLTAALGPMLDVENLKATHDHLHRLGWTAEQVFGIPLNLITLRAATSEKVRADHARELFARICKNDDLKLDDIEVAAAQLWPKHTQRSAALAAQHGERLDHYHTRFAEHYWFHALYTKQPSLTAHMSRLLLLLAAQRILLVNDPEIATKLDAGETVDQELLDHVQVRAVSNLSRNMEHNVMLNDLLSAVSNDGAYTHTQRLAFV